MSQSMVEPPGRCERPPPPEIENSPSPSTSMASKCRSIETSKLFPQCSKVTEDDSIVLDSDENRDKAENSIMEFVCDAETPGSSTLKFSQMDTNLKLHLTLMNTVEKRSPPHERRSLELRQFDFLEDSKFIKDASQRLYTPKNKRKQEIYEQLFINWRPVDDFMLLCAMIHINDIEIVHRVGAFTRPFSLKEVKMRWEMFLVDDITYNHITSRLGKLSGDHKMLIWMDLPYSLAEMEVLSAVSPYARPTRQDFRVLKASFPEVFPKYRPAAAIETHWKWMLAMGMLEHCVKSDQVKPMKSTILFLKPKTVKTTDDLETSSCSNPGDTNVNCNCNHGPYPENDFSLEGFEDYELPPLFPSNLPVFKPDSNDIRQQLYDLTPRPESLGLNDLSPTRLMLPCVVKALKAQGILKLPRVHFQGFLKKYPVTEFRFFIGRGYPWSRPHVDLYDEGESLRISPKQALVEFNRFTGAFTIRNVGESDITVNRRPLPQGQVCPLPVGSILQFHRCVLFFDVDNVSNAPLNNPYENEVCFNARVWREKLVMNPRGRLLPRYQPQEVSTEVASKADPELAFAADIESVVDNLVNVVVARERVGTVRNGTVLGEPGHHTWANIDRVRMNFSRRSGVFERPPLRLLPTSPSQVVQIASPEVVKKTSSPLKPTPMRSSVSKLTPLQAATPIPPPKTSSTSSTSQEPTASSNVVQVKSEFSTEPVTKPAKTPRKPKEPKEKKPRKVREKKIKPPKPPKPPKEKKPRQTAKSLESAQPSATFFHAPMFTGQGGRPLDAPFISTAAPVTFHTLTTSASSSTTTAYQVRRPSILRKPAVHPTNPPANPIPPGFVPLSTVAPVAIQIRKPAPPTAAPVPKASPSAQRLPGPNAPMVIMPRGQVRGQLRPPQVMLKPPNDNAALSSAIRMNVPRMQRPMPVIVSTAPMPMSATTISPVRTISAPRPVRNPNPLPPNNARIPVIQGQPKPQIRLLTRPTFVPNPPGFRPSQRPPPPRGASNFVFLKPTPRPRAATPASEAAPRATGPRPGAPQTRPSLVASSPGQARPIVPKPGSSPAVSSTVRAKAPSTVAPKKAPASRPPAGPASRLPAVPKPATASTSKPPPAAKKATASASKPPSAPEAVTTEPSPQKRRPGRPRKYVTEEEPPAKKKK